MISKSNEHAARVRFEITSMISDQIAQHEVQLPLYYIHLEIIQSLFIAKIQDYTVVSTNILLIQLGTKVAKFAIQWFSLSFIFLQFDWLP